MTITITGFGGMTCTNGMRAAAGIKLGGVVSLPLAFISQPQAKTVDEYSLATFSCEVAGGTAPYSYQWKKNGTNVGTNSANLSFTAAATDNGASISVVVTDSAGTVITSTPAVLGVTRTSVRFNGSTQYVNIPDVQYDFNSLTVDITAKVESENFPRVIYWGGNYDWYISVRSSTSIRLAWYASPSERFVDVTLPTSVGERVIKAEFMGAGGMRLTVDGISASNNEVVSPSLKGTTTQIGKRDYGVYFSGIIRRVVISQSSTVIRDYRMNDGFAANPVCKDYASGSDGQYINIISSSWSSS